MLVLSRKVGQVIKIGDDVEVVVEEIDRGKVRLGVRAPLAVQVNRKEVQDRIDQQKRVSNAATDSHPPISAD